MQVLKNCEPIGYPVRRTQVPVLGAGAESETAIAGFLAVSQLCE
jgi:hypothetical protein